MDNMKDVIILLIMVAVTIIGSLSKSKKKSTMQQHSKPAAEKSPWEDFFPSESTDEPVESYEDARVIVPQVTQEIITAKQQYNNELAKQNRPAKKYSNEVIVSEKYIDTESITAEFDLRKAVIYSEILKPKFNE